MKHLSQFKRLEIAGERTTGGLHCVDILYTIFH
uniref:Uncharacterized protein n=1 Tax=Anguilla anguilla TaxID=7936 RepID=A0A0E9U6R5_ANGAN